MPPLSGRSPPPPAADSAPSGPRSSLSPLGTSPLASPYLPPSLRQGGPAARLSAGPRQRGVRCRYPLARPQRYLLPREGSQGSVATPHADPLLTTTNSCATPPHPRRTGTFAVAIPPFGSCRRFTRDVHNLWPVLRCRQRQASASPPSCGSLSLPGWASQPLEQPNPGPNRPARDRPPALPNPKSVALRPRPSAAPAPQDLPGFLAYRNNRRRIGSHVLRLLLWLCPCVRSTYRLLSALCGP